MAAILTRGCATVPPPGTVGPMDLRSWILAEHDALLGRFDTSIVAHVPPDRWRDGAGPGGSSIAHLMFHAAWHEDLAIGAVVAGREPLLVDRRRELGLAEIEPHRGLGETEDPQLTAALDLDALHSYATAVHAATTTWLEAADLDELEEPMEPAGQLEALAGVDETQVPWLVGMWTGRPVSWFVQWEAIGHRQNHLGEMIGLRSRLGLSPF
jgi:hypothetical protein